MELDKIRKRIDLLEKKFNDYVTRSEIILLEKALAAMINKYLREPTRPEFGKWGDDNKAKVLAIKKKECDELSGNDDSNETSL